MGTVRWLLGVRRLAGPRAPRSWRGAPAVRIAAASGLWEQEAACVQAPMCEREVVFQNGNLCLSQASQFKHPTTIISERAPVLEEAPLVVACLHQSVWIFFPLDCQYFLAWL